MCWIVWLAWFPSIHCFCSVHVFYYKVFVCILVDFSANNFAMQHKRKTISGQDVLDAMKEMEFERFVEPLKRSLECKSSLAHDFFY